MGRIVINETENKQTVILNDSPAGVEGGYFDAQMIWHDMGSGGGDVSADDFDFLIGGISKSYSGVLANKVYKTSLQNRFNLALPVRNDYIFESGDAYDIIGFGVSSLEYEPVAYQSGTIVTFLGDTSQTSHGWGKIVDTDYPFIWLDIKRSDDANITDADIAAFKAQLKVMRK